MKVPKQRVSKYNKEKDTFALIKSHFSFFDNYSSFTPFCLLLVQGGSAILWVRVIIAALHPGLSAIQPLVTQSSGHSYSQPLHHLRESG